MGSPVSTVVANEYFEELALETVKPRDTFCIMKKCFPHKIKPSIKFNIELEEDGLLGRNFLKLRTGCHMT